MASIAVFKKVGPAALIALILLAYGCGGRTPAVVYYTLNHEASDAPRSPAAADGGPFLVGVGPVAFPQLLDRPQIVTRSGPNRIEISEFHRWGAPLREAFGGRLVEDLNALLPKCQVTLFPRRNAPPPQVRIGITVHRFDGHMGQAVFLDATWTISGPEQNAIIARRRYVLQEPATGDGYDSLVAAQSRAVTRLSRELAEALHQIQADGKW